MPFKNKNRKLRNYSIVRLFVAVFLFVGVVSVLSFLSKFVFAAPYTEAIKSIELTSQRSSFASNTPGSWHVTKSAQWIEEGKARITFDVDTVRKTADGTYTDIIMVIDNSGSMSGDKMTQVKSDATELINSVLSNTNNKMALVSFESNAVKRSNFTNNKSSLLNLIDDLQASGCTNYYDGFKKAEEILEGYQKQSNRELIMLFLTDGYPNEDTPNEIAEYHALKQMYPYMTINGIQYEMGDEILEPIANVSDNQFIANISSLNNILFEASVSPYVYENFTITDYIDNTYWDVESIDDIDASIGDVDLTYDGATPKVTWTMNEMLMSGKSAQLTIVVTLKDNLNLPEGSFLPTNKSETITSELPETPDENVSSTLTPVLKTTFDVTYEPNLPSDCSNYGGTLPAEEIYNALSVVQVSTNKISCDGYNFKGWEVAEGDPKILNDDYFKIIDDDVTLRATWAKVSISKAMDGEVHEEVVATLLSSGENLNVIFKQLSGQSGATYTTTNSTITAIKSADSMSATQQANAQIISGASSPAPIYAWFDDTDGSIYIYSDADIIKTDSFTLLGLFQCFKALVNIDGVTDWNTTQSKRMDRIFSSANALVDINALANWDTSNIQYMYDAFSHTSISSIDILANWDTSNVEDMRFVFEDTLITNIDALANWDTSNVRHFSGMFSGASNLTDISGLANWDTSSATDLYDMFYEATSLDDISGLANWNTSNVTSMNRMFGGTSIANTDALANWSTSSVTNMGSMFQNASVLANIDGISGWDTSNVTNMSYMFYGASSLTNIDALANWDTSSVTNMDSMFWGASSLTNIDGASGWNTSNVTNMNQVFYNASSLANIDALSSWDTSSVTNMSGMFRGVSGLTNIDALANWDTSSVTSMDVMFSRTNITDLNALANWDISNVTSIQAMFYNVSSLMDISGVASWNTSSVTSMSGTFKGASITDINALANWDTSSVTNMSEMFRDTSKLSDINGVSNWNTSNVTRMDEMFEYSKLITNLDAMSNWNTSNITDMSFMFQGATSLEDISGVLNWDTSRVTDMSYMFSLNSTLTDISALSNWNTSSVTDMRRMFYSDSHIVSLDPIFEWDTTNVTVMKEIFTSIPLSIQRPTWYDGT